MIRKISICKDESSEPVRTLMIDDEVGLSTMYNRCVTFFSKMNTVTKRERYSDYRGFMVLRNSMWCPKHIRKTLVFAHFLNYNTGEDARCLGPYDMFCVSTQLANEKEAFRLVDKIVETGVYYYGIKP